MANSINVIIDTNVIVSSLLSQNEDSATVKVLNLFYNNKITLYYSNAILKEYTDVLNRRKFNFDKNLISIIIKYIKQNAILIKPKAQNISLLDIKDKPFYEIVMDDTIKNSKLITGNLKHFPINPKIMTPNEFLKFYSKQ